MNGISHFEKKDHDVVFAWFEHWVLETPEDVDHWANEVERELGAFGKKVDLIIDLSGLQVKFAAGRAFGQRRAHILATFTRSSYRINSDDTTEMFLRTSQLITGAP